MLEYLGGVEIEALVQLLELAVEHGHAVQGHMACHITGLVEILPVVLPCLQALGTENQGLIVTEANQVRTFPHIAKFAQAVCQLSPALPAGGRFLINEDCPRLIFPLGTDDKIAAPVAAEKIGVTEMPGIPRWVLRDDDCPLCQRAVLLQGRPALGRGAHARLVLGIAGIKCFQLAVNHCTAAGIAAILVMGIRRPEGQLRHPVMNEITGGGMCPAFILMHCAQGIPLEKNMVSTIKISKSVGVIDQAEGHLQMETVMPAMPEGQPLTHPGINLSLVKSFHRQSTPQKACRRRG